MLKEDIDTKTLNARTQKWREMISRGLFSDVSLLAKRVKKGVPPGMRMVVWPRLLHLKEFMQESKESFDTLIKQRSVIEREIRLDIPRTFTEEKAELMRISLFNVLKALSLVYPELGYCQGMNHLSMKILETVTDETGFWIMNYLIRNHRDVSWNYKNPSSTSLQNFVLDRLMRDNIPHVRRQLEKQEIPLEAFTPKWFITLFSSTLPIEIFCRVFDCFFLEGYKVIYQTALALIKVNEKSILENEVEDNLILLMNKGQYEDLNDNKFINTVYSFPLTDQLLQKLESQYLSIHSQDVIRWQEESQRLYQARIQEKKLMNQGELEQSCITQPKEEVQLILFQDAFDN